MCVSRSCKFLAIDRIAGKHNDARSAQDAAPTETGLRAAPGVAPPSMFGFFKPSSRSGTVLVVVTTSAAEGVSASLGRPILGVVLGQVHRTS